MKSKKVILLVGFVLSFFAYYGFINTIFQKTYSFNKVTRDDKKQILFSENAFYYSFYERLAKTENWSEVIEEFRSYDRVQYPERINVFKKYSIGPEVLGSALYRTIGKIFEMDAFDFYITYVILVSALGMGVLYLLAHELTGSIVGGIMAVFFVIFSFPWSSRLIVSPALRENFGIPTLILQIYFIVKYLKSGKTIDGWLVFGATILHIFSWQFSTYTLLIEILALFLLRISEKDKKLLTNVLVIVITMFFYKIISGGVDSNNHVFEYIKFQLFGTPPNFHVMMYHCSGGFEIISSNILITLFENLLLIMAVFGWLQVKLIKGMEGRMFRLLRLLSLGYLFFGVIVNRFIVLAIPFLALSAVMIFSPSYWNAFIKSKDKKWILVARSGVFLFILFFWWLIRSNDIINVLRKGMGSGYSMSAEPYKWIMENTEINNVFGASMPLTSKILLITGRKISNNPFYEDVSSREKTFEIYRMYGRESEAGMYEIACKNGLDYLIVEKNMCYRKSLAGCSSSGLYISEDKNIALPPLCRSLGENTSENFEIVFEDSYYRILKVL